MTTGAAAATAVGGRPGRGSAGLSGTLAGTGQLARLAIRRDRVMLPAWVYALTVVIGASGGYGLKSIYKTAADRASLASTVHKDAALTFLYGQLHGSSLGAIASWRYLMYGSLAAGLMSIFLVVRHTRADEETGRLELVGSAAVGRRAPLAVALLLAASANVLLFVLTALVLAFGGLPVVGSVAFALAEAGCGLVFAGLAAIAAQVSGTARGARGMTIAALVVAFMFRAVGDSGGGHGLGWLTWLSPMGWSELVRPFAAERWWVFALPAAATLGGIAVAFALAALRDHGAGMMRPRPGPASGGRLLAGPAGLAWRLQRAALAGWAAGFLVGGLAIGVVGKSITQLVGSSGAVDKALREIGGQTALMNAYLAATMSLIGLIAAAYAVSVVVRLRSEETDGHAEPVLASPVGRVRFGGSQLLVVLAGTAVVLVVAGIGVGLGIGIADSDVSTELPRLVGAGLAQLPAALAVAAVGVVFLGLLPQWSAPAAWIALAVCGFIGVFGPALKLSQPVLDVSPLTHVPKLPGGTFSATPIVWLSVAVLAMTAVGLAGLRRRDIG
jgi:ABC-2 type transport system permease protein